MTVAKCAADVVRGREWIDTAPPLTTRDIREMTALCQDCPLQTACYKLGRAGQFDADGIYTGPATGVYGGVFFRHGVEIDVTAPVRHSIYKRVHWDANRRRWRAAIRRGRQTIHLGYYTDEDKAGRVVSKWMEEDSRRRVRRTHCQRGHQLTRENVYTDPRGKRYCRKCRQARQAAFLTRRRQASARRGSASPQRAA